ncbi:MAG: glycosyltransferase [Verrucomicrobia bacterium]|nr:glycosyltransferase [Verrucomicrobiota bacterium]
MSPLPTAQPNAASEQARLRVSGKFLRVGAEKVSLKGISYGPFRPNAQGAPFPEELRLTADLEHIAALGFDTVRLYDPPTEAVLSLAEKLGLRLMVGIPWTDHVDFLRDAASVKSIMAEVCEAVTRLRDHPSVVAFLIGNEIEKTLVRWMGPQRVQHFLERLIQAARECAPNQLFSYATYPSTEYLIPRNADFLAVNVYLEQPAAFEAYLQRLHHLAGNKPLLITEFGLDVASHGAAAQAEARQWFEQICARSAVAGMVWFSYTDEWFRGGEAVTQWKFGIVDQERRERLSAKPVQLAPLLNTWPKISVIVCTYYGDVTLRACLTSLQSLRYPDYEVLLIDDGSSAGVSMIAQDFPSVRYIRQEHAGLSVARNRGAAEALGEILAYTDDDCIADEDWLAYLAAGFDDPQWVACGGPNIPPPPRNETETVVALAPGAPAHVLLSDVEAEHLPGCNLAIRKRALDAIGGFDPAYQVAGDDVDICWRLRDAGGRLRFISGAMVWHHRRYTVDAYFRQQTGYGHAESLLMLKHPKRFGGLGGARWSGAIYGDTSMTDDPSEGSIFHGPMGNGLFQGIYQQSTRSLLDLFCGFLGLLIMLLMLLLKMKLLGLGVAVLFLAAAYGRMRRQTQSILPLSFIRRLQLLYLHLMQPIKREQARMRGLLAVCLVNRSAAKKEEVNLPSRPKIWSLNLGERSFWNESNVGRDRFLDELRQLIHCHGYTCREDDGWQRMDVEAKLNSWLSIAFLTVTEYHGNGRCLTRVRAVGKAGALGYIPLLVFAYRIRKKALQLSQEAAENAGLTKL